MKKRRGNGEGTVLKIGERNYKAIYVVGWKDPTHPIKRTKQGFRTAKEAREYIALMQDQMRINDNDINAIRSPNLPSQKSVVINIYNNNVRRKKDKEVDQDLNKKNESIDLHNDVVLNSNGISIEDINRFTGEEFEKFCANILSRNGFSINKLTGGAGDQGVDIIASKEGISYAIQCKRYSKNLGNTSIQEVVAGKSYYKCHVGVVMTNSYFTKKAIALAQANGTLLWDRSKLVEMINNVSKTQQ